MFGNQNICSTKRVIAPARCRARRAMVAVYSIVFLTSLVGVGSLAVDWGRVSLIKTEMQRAVDAAARSATMYLPSDTAGARTAAIAAAGSNEVDGDPLVLQSGDVVFGKWDSTTKTLDTASSTPDSCRITAYRTTARGNPVQLLFAQALGLKKLDMTYSTIAQSVGGTPAYGIVGLNSFNMNSSTTFTGSYNSSTGTFTTGTSSNDGSIACNSNMNLNANASIGGTVYYYTSSAPNGGKNYDAKTKMSSAISTPSTPAAGAYISSNSNGGVGLPTSGVNINQSSGSFVAPGGNYVLNSFNFTGGTVSFTGPTTLWVYGNFTFSGGTLTTYQNKPANLKINICQSAGVNMGASSNLYAVINAPTSPLNLTGTGSIVGSVMASGVSMGSSGGIYYDNQLGTNGGSSTSTISTVK